MLLHHGDVFMLVLFLEKEKILKYTKESLQRLARHVVSQTNSLSKAKSLFERTVRSSGPLQIASHSQFVEGEGGSIQVYVEVAHEMGEHPPISVLFDIESNTL